MYLTYTNSIICVVFTFFFSLTLSAQVPSSLDSRNINTSEENCTLRRCNENLIIMSGSSYNDSSYTFYFPKNSIFIEILGCGGLYSINFERLVFWKRRNALSMRVGGGMYPWLQATRWAFPVLVNYRFALSKSVSLEAGLGGSYIHESQFLQSSANEHDMLYLNGTIGFSFLIGKHFLIKTAFTPSISTSYFNPMPLSGGLSLGYSFGLPEHLRNSGTKRLFLAGRDYSPRNCVFIELLGGGYIYSANYERLYLFKPHHFLNNSIGYSILKIRGDFYHVVPVFINYQYKISTVTSIELGFGIKGVTSNALRWNAQNESSPVRGLDLLGNIGFRFLTTDHFFIKTNIKPLIMNNSELIKKGSPEAYLHWIGLSFGYCWGKGKM